MLLPILVDEEDELNLCNECSGYERNSVTRPLRLGFSTGFLSCVMRQMGDTVPELFAVIMIVLQTWPACSRGLSERFRIWPWVR